ncbi:nucleic acid dioxygenase ALKBH1 isoform X2 [Halyomorpha halys]|uniref:nucleic acid dioxygenase ALKBH1 isoform X2 n=1 Tax=Halyomorpha halys TaxID=286706 RepID=UPI0006D51810|nr:nucleic acid dioxygenase ALKBH1 isoform X2 [Halyomorpha halys]
MFRDLFKYYKSKAAPPDLSSVLYIEDESENIIKKQPLPCSNELEQQLQSLGLVPSLNWKLFEHAEHAGLFILKNPFTDDGAYSWIKREAERGLELFDKLRWVTLGYHHDWDRKVYSESNKSEFPKELACLISCLGQVIGGWDVKAEAGIVNIYHMNSTLSGHTDSSEPNSTAPLFSISFGQRAIFLIGGRKLEDKATPIMLENGDVIVMSGDSRLCYHGVPRIVPTPWPKGDEYIQFLSNARINLNIRQVLNIDQNSL